MADAGEIAFLQQHEIHIRLGRGEMLPGRGPARSAITATSFVSGQFISQAFSAVVMVEPCEQFMAIMPIFILLAL
jgi:hypothetical protein